jgi:Protein of unknown function (DUF3551)
VHGHCYRNWRLLRAQHAIPAAAGAASAKAGFVLKEAPAAKRGAASSIALICCVVSSGFRRRRGVVTMKSFLCAVAVLAAMSLFTGTAAKAQNYPWCAQYKGLGGATNCGFVSFEQCLATVSGIGGFCMPNNLYQPQPRLYRRRG